MTAAILFDRKTGEVLQVTTWGPEDPAPSLDHPSPNLVRVDLDDATYARIDIPTLVAAVIASQPGGF